MPPGLPKKGFRKTTGKTEDYLFPRAKFITSSKTTAWLIDFIGEDFLGK